MEQIGICRQRKRNSSISSLNSELYIDPDNDLRDPIFSGGESTDDECDESLPESLKHLCGLNHTTSELLTMSGHAFDKAEVMAEEMAKQARQACEKAEEMARHACDRAEEMAKHARDKAEEVAWQARDRAEEMARHACEKCEEMARQACDRAEEVARHACEKCEEMARHAWTLVHHHHLPKWLHDNEFLTKGHRPQLYSFSTCFRSIFRVHTETGNIWTHLLGFMAFIVVAVWFLVSSSADMEWQEKVVFSAFFSGAILCLGFSWMFHTVYCHSEKVGRIFCKLDYCGISFLIMGSAVPWLYYSFYCRSSTKIIYLAVIISLGIICITISMWDRFSRPDYRPVRAGAFMAFGLSGCVPVIHHIITDGYHEAVNFAALGTLIPMALLYLSGALIYAARFPESVWPGKFNFWFQSHQIFHVCVVAAAFIHYYGMAEIANNRLTFGHCFDNA